MRIAAILLSLASLVAAAPAQETEQIHMDTLVKAFSKFSYNFQGPGMGTRDEYLTRKGLRVVIRFNLTANSDGPANITSISLVRRYQLDQPVNSDALNDHSSDAIMSGITYTHYLDHTLVANKRILLVPGFNEERLRQEIDAYFEGIDHLERVLPKDTWKVYDPGVGIDAPLDEQAIVDQALGEDFGFLVRKWGWWGLGPSTGNGPTWWETATIDGKQVDLRGVVENGVVNPYKFTIRIGLQGPKLASATTKSTLEHLTWATTTFGDDGAALVGTTIDLRKGMTVADLKKTIETFVHKTKALAI